MGNDEHYSPEKLATNESFILWVYGQGEEHWASWANASKQNAKCAEQAREMVLAMKFKTYEMSKDRVALIKNKIEDRVDQHEGKRFFMLSGKWRVAAVITLLLASMVVWYSSDWNLGLGPLAETTRYKEKTTPKGAKITFKLSDGTKVNLNADSKLVYPAAFQEGKREVYLEGEAFFDVEENPEKPFVVHTGHIQTRVLGTTFNVKARPNEEMVQVALVTGAVSLYNAKSAETLLLKPDQMATINKSNQKAVKTAYNTDLILGWKNQLLAFSNTDFDQVIETLENWYGVTVIVKRKERFAKGFTGKYKNKSLETVMRGLSFSYGFEYKISDKIVVIH